MSNCLATKLGCDAFNHQLPAAAVGDGIYLACSLPICERERAVSPLRTWHLLVLGTTTHFLRPAAEPVDVSLSSLCERRAPRIPPKR